MSHTGLNLAYLTFHKRLRLYHGPSHTLLYKMDENFPTFMSIHNVILLLHSFSNVIDESRKQENAKIVYDKVYFSKRRIVLMQWSLIFAR
jgi:hypothetical protein